MNTRSDIALSFNDQSVLENHHLFHTFQLLRIESYSVLDKLSDQEQRVIRESMINQILGTDMKVHFSNVGALKARLQLLSEECGDILTLQEDRSIMLKSILHAADISNPVKEKEVYLSWTARVMKEFREQGKKEEELDLPVSPFCGADADVARCQKGFIEYVVRPLYTLLCDTYPPLKVCIDNLDANFAHWKEQESQIHAPTTFRRRKSTG